MRLTRSIGRHLPPALFALMPLSAWAALDCPDPIGRLAYRVEPMDIEDEREAAVGGVSTSSIVLGGLAQWIEARAEAELRLWVMENTIDRICDEDADYRGYFPATCRLSANLEGANTLRVASTYELFIRTIREDIQYAPACAVYQFEDRRLPIGYLVQSIYDQHELGESLDRLFYGLSKHPLLNRVADGQGERLCRQTEEGLTSYCGVVIPVLAYAAARETDISGGDYDQFFDRLQSHLQRAELPAVANRLNNADVLLAGLQREFEKIAQIEERLSEESDLPREEAVGYLLQIAASLSSQFQIAFRLSGVEQPGIAPVAEVLSELVAVYGSMQSREYVAAIARLVSIAGALNPVACVDSRSCPESLMRIERLASTSLTIASLAEAKSADDFAQRLDEIAAPVGAYRLRRQGPLMAISALPGISYGEQELVIGESEVFSGNSAAAFAPVGLSMTWPRCGAVCGVYISFVDLGNLLDDTEGTIQADGTTISGETDSSFTDVFAPGAYFTFAPKKFGPVVFGFGSSYGPSGRKTGVQMDGSIVDVDREWRLRAFVAVDIVMFPFRSR